ncbi:hypothetical protein [Campylobacter concisus]|nr:hypothetical protein [Campylobacter concisus]
MQSQEIYRVVCILQRLFLPVKKQLAVVIEFAKGLNLGFESY